VGDNSLIISICTSHYKFSRFFLSTPIHWVCRALSSGVKHLGHGADHSPPSCVEVKECMEPYLHSPETSSWGGAQLSAGTILPFTLEAEK